MKSMLTSPSRCNMRSVNMCDISQPRPNAMMAITPKLISAKRRRRFNGGETGWIGMYLEGRRSSLLFYQLFVPNHDDSPDLGAACFDTVYWVDTAGAGVSEKSKGVVSSTSSPYCVAT